MKQDTLLEMLSQELIQGVEVHEGSPSKGKALERGRPIWTLVFTLMNGNQATFLSARGTPREWASLDTLNDWLKSTGISSYKVFQEEVGEK